MTLKIVHEVAVRVWYATFSSGTVCWQHEAPLLITTSMIDQDYVELLSRTPPSGDVLEWTFSTRLFASAFAGLLVGTPALCTILHLSGVSDGDSDLRHGGVDFRVSELDDLCASLTNLASTLVVRWPLSVLQHD